ncbi:hypothetical protein EVAR_45427_1 [Eumeta japonica]|uniref:Uncharacterized protein n=1 Tax=Eumeta variegata TaxID=151549 RepID=A0A4C1ZI09_EUMVA|nr:hypothetical protein EVAR_45427_1 [Eumeta japonica]
MTPLRGKRRARDCLVCRRRRYYSGMISCPDRIDFTNFIRDPFYTAVKHSTARALSRSVLLRRQAAQAPYSNTSLITLYYNEDNEYILSLSFGNKGL